jgi:hypothetical protein
MLKKWHWCSSGKLEDLLQNEIAQKQNKMAMALLNAVLAGDAMSVFVTKTYSNMYPHVVQCLVRIGLRKDINLTGSA